MLASLLMGGAFGQDYSGPKPPKPDVPYLLHADNLLSTEIQTAKEEQRKDGLVFVMPGSASTAKTPMAEPIFIFEANKIAPESLELYRLTVNGGNREVNGGNQKKHKGGTKPLRLTVTKVGDRLYRVESYETLEPGEYSLSPNGSNQAFCFAVY